MWIEKDGSRGQFNIIIVPGNGGAATTFNLSGAMLRWAIGLIITILFFLLTSTCFFYSRYTYVSRQLVMSQKVSVAGAMARTLSLPIGVNGNTSERLQEVQTTQTVQGMQEVVQEEKRPTKKEVVVSEMGKSSIEEVKEIEVYLIPGEKSREVTLASKIKLREEKLRKQQLYIPSVKSCEGVITSYFGARSNPFNKSDREVHKGIDIANDIGTPIYASAKGIVIEASYLNGYGYVVYIDHGNGIETRYAHNSKLYVQEGDAVEKGEEIAAMGSTGNSTGSHLHFEIREDDSPIDPGYLFYEEE